MKNDITADLSVLQDHLEDMLNRLYENSLILKRFQSFEIELLKLSSLSEMVSYLLKDAKTFFDLDVVSLCLLDENAEIAGFLMDDSVSPNDVSGLILIKDSIVLRSAFGLSLRPFLGGYKKNNCVAFFPDLDRKPISIAMIPIVRRGVLLGSLNLGSYTSNRFIDDMATDFIEHLVSVISVCLENSLNVEKIRRSSLVDALTGIHNRRFLEQRLIEELNRSQRNQQPLTCLFVDIDFFKKINDTYGHQAGDYVLVAIAGALKKQLRSNDVLARYGGEEFVILLPNTDEVVAIEIAERIRLSLHSLAIEFDQQQIQITVSGGVACYRPGATPTLSDADIISQLIQKADDALYFSKHHGRNQVTQGQPVFDTLAENRA